MSSPNRRLLLSVVPSAPRDGSRPALVPAVDPDGPIPPGIDQLLGVAAHAARAGDRDALSALHTAFAPRLAGWIGRSRRVCYRPWFDPAVEPEDIEQTAFLVFAELVAAWPGRDSFAGFVISRFPWRLSDAIRALADSRASAPFGGPECTLADGSAAAAEALALLEALAAGFPPRERQILLWRVRDGIAFVEIARRLGLDRQTVARCWRTVCTDLRASLEVGPDERR